MPDGDIFQRTFRGAGTGWTKIARLLIYNDSRTDLDQRITQACAANLRSLPDNFVTSVVGRLITIIRDEKALQQGAFSSRRDNYLILDYALKTIDAGEAFEIGNIVRESARAVFISCRGMADVLTSNQVQDKFAEELIYRVIDSRLCRIRDIVQTHGERTVDDQLIWEKQLHNRIKPYARKMIDNCLSGDSGKFRSPRFPKRLPKTTMEHLRQALPTL